MRIGNALVLVAVVSGCAADATYEKPPTPVTVYTIQPAAPPPGTRYSAVIQPGTDVALAFRASGYVETIATVSGAPIDAGDRVTADQVLARVRPADADERVNQARAALTEAEAALGAARAAVERARQLFDERSLTRPELEAAEAAFEAARARVDGAGALLRAAEIAGADTALRSPLDGIVIERRVEVGSLVTPGAVAFRVADVTDVKAVFGAPDTLVGSLRIGAVVPVTVEAAPGRSFEGRIRRIAPVADPLTRVFDVELAIANTGRALRPGMVASVAVGSHSEAPPAILLPISAIVRAAPGTEAYAVFVLDESGGSGVARRRDVRLGGLVGNRVEVPSGLQPGEQVIVNGATVVVDGETVSVVR